MNPVVDRIKKLLRLSKSPNPHEAALALERAMEIAAKNRIQIATLDLSEGSEVIEERSPVGRRITEIQRLAADVAQTFFNVDILVSRCALGRSLVWIGRPADIATARFVFVFISRQCSIAVWAFRKSLGRRATPTRVRSFMQGWYVGVAKSLKDRFSSIQKTEQSFALVLVKDRAARSRYLAKAFPDLRKCKRPRKQRRDTQSLLVGYRMGSEVEINRPIEASRPMVAIA